MTAHQGTAAQIEALVHNLPEFIQIAAGGAGSVYQIYGDYALIESSVKFVLVSIIFVYSQKRTAAHTGVAVTVFKFFYDFFRNVIWH